MPRKTSRMVRMSLHNCTKTLYPCQWQPWTPVGRSFRAVGEITLLEWKILSSCHHPNSIRTENLILPLTWTNSKWYWWNGFMCSRGTLYSVSNSLLGWSAVSSITTAGKKQRLIICAAKFCLKKGQDCRAGLQGVLETIAFTVKSTEFETGCSSFKT